ncbi:putative SNF2 family helicase, partial [Aspergillus homomorphus CBS 101889]
IPELSDAEVAALLQGMNGSVMTNSVENAEPTNPVPSADKNKERENSANGAGDSDDGNSESLSDNMSVICSSSSGTEGAHDLLMDATSEVDEQGDRSEWPDEDFDDIVREELSNAKFKAAKRHFRNIANPSMEDKIRFEAAKMKEEARRRIQPPRNKSNRISAEEKRKSKKYGLDLALKQGDHKTARKSRKRKSGEATPDAEKAVSEKARKKIRISTEFFKDLLAPNVIEDAHASASAEAMPKLSEKNKEAAFKRLIASIPAADHSGARSDQSKIIDATRKFSKLARMDGKGGYRIPGMKTSLYHYQLQGAAFMRDRENSSVAPSGGFLSDFMGLGKTIQALANIVDGQPPANDPVKTTLIVVPSQLVSHWNTQITNHCDGIDGSEVLTYNARTRLSTLNTTKSLQKYSVIITTYEEVRMSYPKCNQTSVPTGDEDEVTAWWNEQYEEKAGPLHRIKFLRIILDEGHIIKNYSSAVSLAVRALTGKYKWILSGTPIHNCLDELYPQFDFLGVPGTKTLEKFMKDFCQSEIGHSRLVNLMRSFMFRRTHASRLFSFPIVKLPDVKDRVVRVQFCDAEREIYTAIQDVFIENLNKCGNLKHPALAQYRCFLTMLLKFRILVAIRKNPTAIRDDQNEHLVHSTTLQGDREKLTKDFYEFMVQLHDSGQWEERLERNNCAQCKLVPVYPVITSCHHLFCEECYSSLFVNENAGQDKPMCLICKKPICEAAYCDAIEELELQQMQASQQAQPPRKSASRRKPKGSFRRGTFFDANEESSDVPGADEETDWIQACAGLMPSAKLTKIREIVAEWLAESPTTKIVIFTQFLDFVRIVDFMCQKEGWEVACLTGSMNLAKRELSMKRFNKKDGNTNILLASLKAGGIGLDLTAANKCILVDLWWNEAIQDQAFCRLWRHGQTQEVEFVKLIVDDTIDDYLLDLQAEKSKCIDETIGDDVLRKFETLKSLLEMFCDVEVERNGAYKLTRK